MLLVLIGVRRPPPRGAGVVQERRGEGRRRIGFASRNPAPLGCRSAGRAADEGSSRAQRAGDQVPCVSGRSAFSRLWLAPRRSWRQANPLRCRRRWIPWNGDCAICGERDTHSRRTRMIGYSLGITERSEGRHSSAGGRAPRGEIRDPREREGERWQGRGAGAAILGPPGGVRRPRPHVAGNLANAVSSLQPARVKKWNRPIAQSASLSVVGGPKPGAPRRWQGS